MPFGLAGIGGVVDVGGWDEAAGNTPQRDDEERTKTIETLVRRLRKNVRIARDHAYLP